MKTSLLIASLTVALAACTTAEELESNTSAASQLAPTCEPMAYDASGVAFSDEDGANVIDMADNATFDELQTIHGIGPKIAQRIIDARPFRGHLNPISKLDAVRWVGPEVLSAWRSSVHDKWCALGDGRQSCCIELACNGNALDAPFAVDDAEGYALLDWANRANLEELMAVCRVGIETAEEIQAARPIRSVGQLEDVRYVGEAILRHMLGHDSYLCSLQGGVFEEWCGLPDAKCFCE